MADLDNRVVFLSGATGTQDLFLRFAGGSGALFNVNWWQFNAASLGNILNNGDVEAGPASWAVFGSGALSSSTSVVHGGTQSLAITGRTASWNGPSQNVTPRVINGKSHATSVWVRSQSGTPSAKVTMAVNANGATNYFQLTPAGTVNSSGWTLLQGTAAVSWSGTLSSATVYVETTAGTDGLYIDDALIQ